MSQGKDQQPPAHDRDLIWKSEDILNYHARQFEEPYRSTLHLGRFMQSLDLPKDAEVLDVGCGAGAPISHLATLFPGFRWTGVDCEGDLLFPLGKAQMEKRGVAVEFVQGDFYKLADSLGGRRFDLVISIQTLPFIPDYRPVLEQLLSVAKSRVIVNCLFTEFDIDARTLMIDYTKPEGFRDLHYNVYSLHQFRRLCEARGFGRFIDREFEMDIDLPVHGLGRGTYTRKLEDGRRLQFSGPVSLPWRFLSAERVEATGRR